MAGEKSVWLIADGLEEDLPPPKHRAASVVQCTISRTSLTWTVICLQPCHDTWM